MHGRYGKQNFHLPFNLTLIPLFLSTTLTLSLLFSRWSHSRLSCEIASFILTLFKNHNAALLSCSCWFLVSVSDGSGMHFPSNAIPLTISGLHKDCYTDNLLIIRLAYSPYTKCFVSRHSFLAYAVFVHFMVCLVLKVVFLLFCIVYFFAIGYLLYFGTKLFWLFISLPSASACCLCFFPFFVEQWSNLYLVGFALFWNSVFWKIVLSQ